MMLFLISVVVVLIAGCAPQASTPAAMVPVAPAAPKVLKVGSMWPLSGPGALGECPAETLCSSRLSNIIMQAALI